MGLFAACSSQPEDKEKIEPPPPTRIEASITASADANPDGAGRASPVRVQVFELAGDAVFLEANFFALSDKPSEALRSDLLARVEWVLTPNRTVTLAREAKPDTCYLGVVVAYQNLDQALWRAIQPLQAHETNALTIRVDRLAVTMTTNAP
ncbi:MAG: type VI secretion system lipoprotein TssJ [Rhodospirillales bacterium]|nr:type VI secretion system lipoprotein TssJ [Rhodospirillales bacterium]